MGQINEHSDSDSDSDIFVNTTSSKYCMLPLAIHVCPTRVGRGEGSATQAEILPVD